MPSKKHNDLIEQFISGKTERVLRIDSRKHPDLILISPEGRLTAVEIELRPIGISEVKTNLEKYTDYDNVLIVTLKRKKPYDYEFKSKRYLSKEIYDKILKAKPYERGLQKQLQNEFGRRIPRSTITMIREGRRKCSQWRNKPEFEVVVIQLK